MKKNMTLLLAAVPLDIYKKMQRKFRAKLDDCFGYLETTEEVETWYGFIKRMPIKVTHRPKEFKTYWTPCDLDFVKQKIKDASA